MACERYREALADVAAGGPAPGGLVAHLASCDGCRDELATRREELLQNADSTFGRITLAVKELFSAGERRPT